ncbi:MAG TPA: hypothetical protein PK777_08185, partial [Thermoguttaceae bacterium]|nr:hypothetical protein [Thermoguttaceae bacterium]
MGTESVCRSTSLLELAKLVGGRVESTAGVDPCQLTISGAAPLTEAGPGLITLVDRGEKAEVVRQSGAA